MRFLTTQRWLLCCLLAIVAGNAAKAQLNQTFGNIFKTILVDRLKLGPVQHQSHFLHADTVANESLTGALNNLIASNISSFPLSSTSAGVQFNFSGGGPASTTESLGPIFAETGETMGPGKLTVGFNYTYLDLSKFRGTPTEDMRFTFTHVDVRRAGLGDLHFEDDYIDLIMGMHIESNVFAAYATYGLLDNFDVGVAVPTINVRLYGTATARINSFTLGADHKALHYFGGDSVKPVLETTVPYDNTTTGIGDIALRFKYSVLRSNGISVGGLLDVRLPTGKEENFLSAGKTAFRVSALISDKMENLTPHLNLGFERNTSNLLSDKINFAGGFDSKLLSNVTFALDILGSVDVNTDKAIKLFPGTVTLHYLDTLQTTPPQTGESTQQLSLSNVPDRPNDNIINVSVGFRYSPAENFLVLVNILSPLNDGGLRANIAPTIGISANL